MIEDEINVLKEKLEYQIENNYPYEKIYKTSVEIDKLLVKNYKIKEKLNDILFFSKCFYTTKRNIK